MIKCSNDASPMGSVQIALEAGEIPTLSPQPGVVVNQRCSGGSGSRNDSSDDEAAAAAAALHGI